MAPALRDSKRHKVVKCTNCGLVQISPTPAAASDKRFYDEGRQASNIGTPTNIKQLRTEQDVDTRRRTKFVSDLLKTGAEILDVGTGYGFFLEAMKRKNFKVTGLEISKAARIIAKKVTRAEILNVNILRENPERKFDAVTAFHVLEHVTDPVEMLRRLFHLLKKNGKLIIEVPNLEDWMLSNSAYSQFYWQRAHISYFNQAILLKILKKAGLKNFNFFFEQRYGLLNAMNWVINHKPQIGSPSFFAPKNLLWLENIYKKAAVENKLSDTLLLVILKN